MVILPDRHVVIITPPKCGSTSIHTYYQERGGIWCIGPQGDKQEIDKHTVHVPFQFKDYRKYVVIRNPKDRFLSLYYHYCRWDLNVDYHRYVTAYEMNLLQWFYQWTIADLVKPLLSDYELIDIEDFEEVFRVSIPKLHVAQNKRPQDKLIVPDSWIECDIPRV